MTVRSSVLLALATSALAACASSGSPPEAAASARADRLVLAPLNLSLRAPSELRGELAPVWQAVLDYFHARDRGVTVLSNAEAMGLWQEAQAAPDGPAPRGTLEAARAAFARDLGRGRPYDLLFVPSLVLRPARLHGRYASWDGVQRLVPGSSRTLDGRIADDFSAAPFVQVLGLRGRIAAASLHVAVHRADGTLVQEGLGGLALIQEARRSHPLDGGFEFAPRSAPFAEVALLRDGVELAFERPLPRTPARS